MNEVICNCNDLLGQRVDFVITALTKRMVESTADFEEPRMEIQTITGEDCMGNVCARSQWVMVGKRKPLSQEERERRERQHFQHCRDIGRCC